MTYNVSTSAHISWSSAYFYCATNSLHKVCSVHHLAPSFPITDTPNIDTITMYLSTAIAVLATSALCYAAPTVRPREIDDWTLSDLGIMLYSIPGCAGRPFPIQEVEYDEEYTYYNIMSWSLNRALTPVSKWISAWKATIMNTISADTI